MANIQIREKIKESRVFQYEVADAMGIAESTCIKLLRKPLDEKKKSCVLQAIEIAKNMKEELS